MKYIEIDGVRYKVDPNDSTKPLMVDGQMVKYEEEAPEPIPPTTTPVKVHDNMSDDEIEALAKTDPALARILRDNKRLKEDKVKAEADAAQARKAEMEKNGEFQKLAEEAERDRDKAISEKNEALAMLEKYKTTVNTIRDNMMSQIAPEKQSLVPEGSARKQIEYILANAQHLGVSIIAKGSPVPKNTDEPKDDEGRDRKRFAELMEKDNLTRNEQNELNDLSKKIKSYDAKK